jgi:hypothetical protein
VSASAPELLEMVRRLTDNYQREPSCSCDRCEAVPAAQALIARIDGD